MYILNIWNMIGNPWFRWFNFTQRVEKWKILLYAVTSIWRFEGFPSFQTFPTAFPAQNLADNSQFSFSLLEKGCQPE